MSQYANIDEDNFEKYAVSEDAPQIVGVVDDRPPELIAQEDYKKNRKWKVLDETKKETDGDGQKFKSSPEWGVCKRENDDDGLSPPRRPGKRPSTSDLSPPRGKPSSTLHREHKGGRFRDRTPDVSPKRRRGSDASPPRKNRNRSQERRAKHSSGRASPRGRKRSRSGSPPRRKYEKAADNSPARSRGRRDSDASPRRRSNRSSDSKRQADSPPRRNRSSATSPQGRRPDKNRDKSPQRRRPRSPDHSPPRRRNRSPAASPPRRRNKSPVASPPRRRNRTPDKSPPRRSNRTPDKSPPRRGNRTPEKSLPQRRNRSPDASPPRRPEKGRDSSSQRRPFRTPDHSPPRQRKRSPDASPPRKPPAQAIKSRASDSPPPTHKKMEKTLDGKRAGLQNATALKEENDNFRKREDEAYRKMAGESSRNTEVVVRDRKTGRIRDLELESAKEKEKKKKEQERKAVYDRWGKGVKQIEEYKERVAEQTYEETKPLARYADDRDLDVHLKAQDRDGDPMAEYMRKKAKESNTGPCKSLPDPHHNHKTHFGNHNQHLLSSDCYSKTDLPRNIPGQSLWHSTRLSLGRCGPFQWLRKEMV